LITNTYNAAANTNSYILHLTSVNAIYPLHPVVSYDSSKSFQYSADWLRYYLASSKFRIGFLRLYSKLQELENGVE
jgi:hypothetical protein